VSAAAAADGVAWSVVVTARAASSCSRGGVKGLRRDVDGLEALVLADDVSAAVPRDTDRSRMLDIAQLLPQSTTTTTLVSDHGAIIMSVCLLT